MKRNAIFRIPLAFLFVPTLLAAVALFVYFQIQLQNSFEQRLNSQARHILYQAAQLSRKPLLERRYAQLKQSLWRFAQNAEPGIENIVVYNNQGELASALTLNDAIIDSRIDALPNPVMFERDGAFQAYGLVGTSVLDDPHEELSSMVGYVWVTFSYEPFGLDYQRNLLISSSIVILTLLFALLLWRYRHQYFNQQLLLINESLNNLNKGYRHSKLPEVKGYSELNALQQQLNAVVGFFEKRLTMKQFEVSALEQTVGQLDKTTVALKNQLVEVKEQQSTSRHNTPSLAADMYRVCYQTLQLQLAAIEQVMNECTLEDEKKQRCTEAVNRVNQLLSELKLLGDVVAEQCRAQLQNVNLEQVIASINSLIKPQAHSKSLEFIVSRPDHDIELELDVNQLQKILIAILQNSVESTTEGYVKLSLEVVELPSPDESGNNHVIHCQILDTSNGMSSSRYALLANDEVDDKLQDDSWVVSGLHLMVAKKTAESLQGQFRVKSLNGLGVQTTVSFPCRVNHLEAPDTSGYLGCKVLLFDPIVESAEPVIDLLSDSGMQVLYCRDGEQLKQTLASNQIHCGILSRPCSAERRAVFDGLIGQFAESNQLPHCLFLSDTPDLDYDLPSSWSLGEKPFVLSALLDYYSAPEQVISYVQSSTVRPDSDVMEILAVDDNETNLKLLSVVLRPYPVKLVQALSGKEAIQYCSVQNFDIILMDKEMPQMNGIETTAHIRQLPLNNDTPVVVFTAHIDDDEKRGLMDKQVDDCMVKPLDQDKFYYLMETWCAKRWQHVSGQ